MILRRVLAFALVLPVAGPSLQGFAVLAAGDTHGCAEGVCHCRHGRPAAAAPAPAPAAAAEGPCHEPAAQSSADCEMTARCGHQSHAIPGTQAPALIPAARTPVLDDAPVAAPWTPAGEVRTGHTRIDSPPPRLG